jgi:hypothetical protein
MLIHELALDVNNKKIFFQIFMKLMKGFVIRIY